MFNKDIFKIIVSDAARQALSRRCIQPRYSMNCEKMLSISAMVLLAVPIFTVKFAIADAVSSQTSAFASAGRPHSALHDKLLGVGEADFRAVTNVLHSNFLKELEVAGLEVVPINQIAASALYRKQLTGSTLAPINAEMREKATTAGDVAGSVAVSLFKLAIGSSDASSSTKREVIDEPARYRDVVGAGLHIAGTMLIARLKSER